MLVIVDTSQLPIELLVLAKESQPLKQLARLVPCNIQESVAKTSTFKQPLKAYPPK